MLKWIARLSKHLGNEGIVATGTAILGAGLLGAGASIAAGEKQAKQAGHAASRAGAIEQAALAEEQRRFGLLEPFREAALASLARLKGGIKPGEESPFFRFRKEEETGALRGQLAASGGLRGGRGLRAISELTRGLTEEESERQFGREFNLAQFFTGAGFPAARGAPDAGGASRAALAGGAAGQPLTSAIQREASGLGPLVLELLKLRGDRSRPSLFGGGGGSSLGTIAPDFGRA